MLRACALLVGLPDVVVVGVGEWPKWLRIVIASEVDRSSCCGRSAHRHGAREVVLVDLPVFGRPARLAWRKQRWRCPICCRCWCDEDPQVGVGRCALTTRAARWATLQVGRNRRAVADVARALGCGWHTVMDAVTHYGTPLINDPSRIGNVTAVGLDVVLFCRSGPFRNRAWSTRSLTSHEANYWTLFLVATLPASAPGSPRGLRIGAKRFVGRTWIRRARIGRFSTRCWGLSDPRCNWSGLKR